MEIIVLLTWMFSATLLFLAAFFLLEVVLSSVQPHSKECDEESLSESHRKRAALIIPAHNEEAVLHNALESVLPQLSPGDDVYVVADNCQDGTASVAECYPVNVLKRYDDKKRGKGYALDFALKNIGNDYDVIIILDADCVMSDQCRDKLVHKCLTSLRPVQCLYLMESNDGFLSLRKKTSEFAWRIKNKLRPLGLKRLGGPCQLMGTGMAFPRGVLDDVELASGCIVEDMKLGLDLARKGYPPVFLSEAVVTSFFPDSEKTAKGQRQRWIHGHLEMIGQYFPSLLFSSFLKGSWGLFLLSIDLLIPPLFLLLTVNIVAGVLLLLLSFLLNTHAYLLSILSIVLLVVAFFLCWFLGARDLMTFRELLKGGGAKLKSLSMYTSFFTSRIKSWNKTSRD